jgi:hypothetical protein
MLQQGMPMHSLFQVLCSGSQLLRSKYVRDRCQVLRPRRQLCDLCALLL